MSGWVDELGSDRTVVMVKRRKRAILYETAKPNKNRLRRGDCALYRLCDRLKRWRRAIGAILDETAEPIGFCIVRSPIL